MLDFEQINTFTLEPSLIGLITTGNLSLLAIRFIKFDFDLSNL